MVALPQITLVEDTREQAGWSELFESPCVSGTLTCGDYSVRGLEHLVAIERKSLPDLLRSLTHERTRFEKELVRARQLRFFTVIVEASAADILHGRFGHFGKGQNSRVIWESCAAFSIRYAPFIFGGDRFTAARLCESLLLKFARECCLTVESLHRAAQKFECHRVHEERVNRAAYQAAAR